jgi:NAD(P)-dependent dehydrogenase (short-subunit alcohol dehydrogenase family)
MKIAIITGGSRGLGKSSALHMADKGVGVILTYNSQKDEADKVVAEIEKKGGKAAAIQLDVSNSKNFGAFANSIKDVLKTKFASDRFDYLVNNAGTGAYVPFTEMTEEVFDSLQNIHFKGPYFLTQKLLPIMNDGGRIVNVSSGLARFSVPGSSAYGALKGAVETWTRYLAKELGPRKITANVVAPGPIATDFGGGRVRDNKDMNAMLSAQTALGRVGEADDIGKLVASLVQDDMGWVNAQRIEASGGIFI